MFIHIKRGLQYYTREYEESYTRNRCDEMLEWYNKHGENACLTFNFRAVDETILNEWLKTNGICPTRYDNGSSTLYINFN